MKREKIALITEEETGFGEICRAALEEKGFQVVHGPKDGGKLLEEGSPTDIFEHPQHPRLQDFLSKVL